MDRDISNAFEAAIGRAPEAIGVPPGRGEVLGNHTDYNGGVVRTVAHQLAVTVAGARQTADPRARADRAIGSAARGRCIPSSP